VRFLRGYLAGEEVDLRGTKIHSEWVRRPVPIIIAAGGPRATQLAGEVGDGVLGRGAHPVYLKWRLRHLREGAERAGRDPSKLEVWVNTMVYVCDKKEDAHREVAGFCATQARGFYDTVFRRTNKYSEELRVELEREQPGLIEACKNVADHYDLYEHETVGARHSRFVTQQVIDFFHLTGRPEEIIARIQELEDLGATNLSNNNYTIIDKVGWMRDVGTEVMARYPSRPAAPQPRAQGQGVQRRS
jgi:alkanesulfonate monooxygenase SsuD/methylene tetrahydromethanopterin reductase-like flavin-dependent oxidoreductase (luciferase family)